MDPTQDIIYRNFKLNDSSIGDNTTGGGAIGSGIAGCVVDNVDFSDVDVVQFVEKRSQQDGMDAGDVFLGARRISMVGTVYDVTRALLYDRYFALRAALNPRLALLDEPGDQGYRPLYFAVPTNRIEDYGLGGIALQVKAMPRAFQSAFSRDMVGGDDGDALALPWQATFICKDPSILAELPQDVAFTANISGNLNHRGTYPSPLNMLFSVGTAAGSISVTIGDSAFTITVPSSTGARTIRFKGDPEKVLTVEEDGVEEPRLDLLAFVGETTWPMIPAGPSFYSITKTGVTLATGTHLWFYERYA